VPFDLSPHLSREPPPELSYKTVSTQDSIDNNTQTKRNRQYATPRTLCQQTMMASRWMNDLSRDTKNADNSISRAADRKNQYYSLLYTEMAERKRVEENLRRSNLLLQALSQAQLQYVAGTDLALVFSSLLRTLLAATQAQQGYLSEQKTANIVHGSTQLHITEGPAAGYNTAQFTSVAEKVLRTGQIVILHPANQDDATLEIGSDTTESATIPAYFLGLPITIATTPTYPDTATVTLPNENNTNNVNIVGVIIIAGSAEEFDPIYLELMQPLVATCAQLIVAHRNDVRRRAAELELAEERILLAERVAERTAELSFSNAELARAARAKDEFLATMNHELRTPLNAVMLYSESLQTQLPGPLNERQLRAVGGIRESAHHLLLLINDILDVAKMDAGKLNLDIVTSIVENVCQGSLRLVSELAQKKRLDLHFNRAPHVTLMEADERRLKQMLVNLLSNAIKFTPEGGKIGLEVNGDVENDTVNFVIWDTGIGLAPEDIKKLFQPFVQLDSSHSRQHGGTGLGLFLVYRMAELHGGSISVTSEVNQGSRFTISLPWHQRRLSLVAEDIAQLNANQLSGQYTSAQNTFAPSTSQKSVEDHATHSSTTHIAPTYSAATTGKSQSSLFERMPTILIADDNEANLRVLSDFLNEWNCRILIARTGVQAIQRTKEERPDLVLMDIQMPEMNGLDAIRQIRAETSLGRLPIIAITALAMPGDREQCLAAGADDYLSKPIQVERLTKVLNVHLRHTQAKEQL